VYKLQSCVSLSHREWHTCQTYSRVCRKYTLRTLRVKITLRVETNLVRFEITLLRVESTLWVWKLHSACINHTRTCRNHTRKCQNSSRVWKSQSAGGNCTLRIEITLLRVEITFERVLIADLFFAFLGGGGLNPTAPSMDPCLSWAWWNICRFAVRFIKR
jgi:hypothetical protein